MTKACKWHSPTPDENCWACQRPRTEPTCYKCGQRLSACRELEELKAECIRLQADLGHGRDERAKLREQLAAAKDERDEAIDRLDKLKFAEFDLARLRAQLAEAEAAAAQHDGEWIVQELLQQQLATAHGLLKEACEWVDPNYYKEWYERAKKEVRSE